LDGRPTNFTGLQDSGVSPYKKQKAGDEKAERILEAVRRLLAQNGFAGTTISLVAQEAGVSRGLLHYYFKNKEEMLAKVLAANMQISVAFVDEIFKVMRRPGDLSRGLTDMLKGIMKNDPEFFSIFLEGFAVAHQSDIVNDMLNNLYGEFRKALYRGLENLIDRGMIHPQLPLGGLAVLMTAIIDGIGLQLLTEPELADEQETWATMERSINDLLGVDG